MTTQGLYLLSGQMSYRKTLRSVKAAKFAFRLSHSLWNLAGTLAAVLSNVRVIWSWYHPILWLQDFKRFDSKTSYCLVNRGPDCDAIWHHQAWKRQGKCYTSVDQIFIELLECCLDTSWCDVNPFLCASFFVFFFRETNLYLHRLYFFNTETCHAVEINSQTW